MLKDLVECGNNIKQTNGTKLTLEFLLAYRYLVPL